MTLHILFTGLVSELSLSGGDQLILDIAPRLPKDIKIVIITPEFGKKHWKKLDTTNIEFRFLKKNLFDLKDSTIFIFISYTIRAWQAYRILKREKKVEAVYSCSDVAYADIWPAFFISIRNPRTKWLTRVYHVLLSPHKRQGGVFANILAFYLQKLSFLMMKKRSTVVLTLNEKLRKEIIEIGFNQNKTQVLGAGIDFELIHKFKPTKKYKYNIVALGRIAPVKGIYDMVKIWKIVNRKRPELQFAWIGEGSKVYRQKITGMIKKERFDKSFSLLGFIDKKEVYNILKSADAFVCPDHENGWGLAVCEAMSCGLPVISYNIDIFGEVYKKGFISVDLSDTTSFADQLIEVINNTKLRNRLSQEAIQQAKEFDHTKVTADLLKYLK